MSSVSKKEYWEEYKEKVLTEITPILDSLGFILNEEQPHTLGERFLMKAVTTTSGRKLILLGKRRVDLLNVVIKVTNDKNGKKELKEERKRKEILNKINFAASAFNYPREVLFKEQGGYCISIHKFIEQDSTYLERPIEEQFFFALNAFKAQEGAHATTYGHINSIKKVFGNFSYEDYIKNFDTFAKLTQKDVVLKARNIFEDERKTVEQYCGFLVHTDFVPHNLRISKRKIYLLDHSSIRFGNKYEGWARFLNFMALYNPKLEKLLVEYVRANRTEEESVSLKLMRMYRLAEIVAYYTNTLRNSEGDLKILNKKRIKLSYKR